MTRIATLFAADATALSLTMTPPAHAAACGNTSSGFEAWKTAFAQEARRAGVRKSGLQALAGARYATRTIAADRNQKSFKYTLQKFMRVRGAETIVAQGRKRKARNPGFYAALERQYGVPAGVLIAIHGMETGFGGFMGDSAIVETIGLGGFAMGAAPAVAGFVGAGAASEAGNFTRAMGEITQGENPEWTIPGMDYLGVPTGIDIRRVVETGLAPTINTGIAHREPGIGQVGAGVVKAPMGCFTAALTALADKLGIAA